MHTVFEFCLFLFVARPGLFPDNVELGRKAA